MSSPTEPVPQGGGSMDAHAKATDLVGELFKLMPATSGIMLALIWGLASGANPAHNVLIAIRVASILLVVSIFLSLLGLQFIVSSLQRNNENAASGCLVSVCFILAEVTFVAGSIAVIWSLFLI
jgi:hypothetical protein